MIGEENDWQRPKNSSVSASLLSWSSRDALHQVNIVKCKIFELIASSQRICRKLYLRRREPICLSSARIVCFVEILDPKAIKDFDKGQLGT